MLPALPPKLNPTSPIFWGPNGLRAGWRLLIFFAITVLLLFGAGIVSRIIGRREVPHNPFEPDVLLRGEAILFGVVVVCKLDHVEI